MARVNLFEMANSIISKESISHPNVDNVTVDTVKELPPQVQEDPEHVCPDEPIKAAVTNTQTSEPGPKDGGGELGADYESAEKAKTNMDVSDVNKNLTRDQNGGHDIDALPNKVNAKDGLKASDISTSVEEHSEAEEGGDKAEETDLETVDASGAETIEKADDMVMDLDGEELEITGITDVTEQKLAEADSISAKADSLSKATATVERYHGLMVKMAKEGRFMSDELRQSIAWGLESIDKELFEPERVALESFNVSNENIVSSSSGIDGSDPEEVGKGLSSKLKKLYEAGLRIFWRLVNAVADLITGFTADAYKIREKVKDLRSRAGVLEGGTEFTLRSGQRLTVGDEFVGDSRQAIEKVRNVTNELLVKFPSTMVKILQDWETSREKYSSGDQANVNTLIASVDTALDRVFRGMTSLSPNDKDKVPSGFISPIIERVQWSGPLPGNMALYTAVGSVNGKDAAAGAGYDALYGVTVDFSLIPEADSVGGEVIVQTPSAGEASIILKELEKLVDLVLDAKEGMANLRRYASKQANRAVGEMVIGGQIQAYMAGYIVSNVAKTSTESQKRYVGYVINLIKAYMGYIELAIKAEAGGETLEA